MWDLQSRKASSKSMHTVESESETSGRKLKGNVPTSEDEAVESQKALGGYCDNGGILEKATDNDLGET